MPTRSTLVRDRLESLRNTVLESKSPRTCCIKHPANCSIHTDNAIPANILAQHGILLLPHSFQLTDSAEANLAHDPPILFEFRDASIFDRHPIAPEPGDRVDKYDPQTLQRIYNHPQSQEGRTTSVARFLTWWAVAGFPRSLRAGVATLGDLCNIGPVFEPHPLHPGATGFQYVDYLGISWRTFVHETILTRTNKTQYPHLTLVTALSCIGHDDSITRGELLALITGMRNRSRRPAESDEEAAMKEDPDAFSDDESDAPLNEEDLLFKDECRFPVLMLSFVGPQHGRLTYACMSGTDLIIRQSKLYSFIDAQSAPLRLFACALLSKPLSCPD
ncbi:hypothetical protein BJX61DRAFT_540697 [Aspergillus egyptiacus]|nr:hypothetical protein BJX61DRAFT_540697 [Aspergillus egyptiacus]